MILDNQIGLDCDQKSCCSPHLQQLLMAGSLRKLKKTRAKVQVGKQKRFKRPGHRTQVPQELKQQRGSRLLQKLEERPSWDEGQSVLANYKGAFVADTNVGFGRNASTEETAGQLGDGRQAAAFQPDDDFRAEILGEVRSSGPAPPAKLTSTQQRIFEGLLSAHGGDLEAMARDKKLNPMLLTVGRLRKMLLSYEAFRDRPQSKTPFRTPHKRLW